jgi:hypothetical protein
MDQVVSREKPGARSAVVEPVTLASINDARDVSCETYTAWLAELDDVDSSTLDGWASANRAQIAMLARVRLLKPHEVAVLAQIRSRVVRRTARAMVEKT